MVISRRRFAENGKEMYRNKKRAREGRAKLLFLFVKYANYVALSPPSRRTLKLPNNLRALMTQ